MFDLTVAPEILFGRLAEERSPPKSSNPVGLLVTGGTSHAPP
jgi:hypothetical protein